MFQMAQDCNFGLRTFENACCKVAVAAHEDREWLAAWRQSLQSHREPLREIRSTLV